MNPTLPSVPATSLKGMSGAGEGAGSCGEVSCFKVLRVRRGDLGRSTARHPQGRGWG